MRRSLDTALIRTCFVSARKNWFEWRDVFEHAGPIVTNPLLVSQERFAAFCKEYSVARTIRAGKQDEFRRTLIRRISEAIQHDGGSGIDQLESELRSRFGTFSRKGRLKGLVSVLSKVGAFARPERLVAWDTFARQGLNLVVGLSKYSAFDSYADYLRTFDEVWVGEAGSSIRAAASVEAVDSLERETRFLRRVLDLCLMVTGGRKWKNF